MQIEKDFQTWMAKLEKKNKNRITDPEKAIIVFKLNVGICSELLSNS